MAFETFRRTVGTSASLLYAHPKSADDGVAGDYGAKKVTLINASLSLAVVCLGPEGVTTSTGARWPAAPYSPDFEIEPGESLYGVVASGSQDIDVIANGR